MEVRDSHLSRVVKKTCGSARLTLVSLVFGDRTFHSFSVHHSSTDAHKNTRTLTSGVSSVNPLGLITVSQRDQKLMDKERTRTIY